MPNNKTKMRIKTLRESDPRPKPSGGMMECIRLRERVLEETGDTAKANAAFRECMDKKGIPYG